MSVQSILYTRAEAGVDDSADRRHALYTNGPDDHLSVFGSGIIVRCPRGTRVSCREIGGTDIAILHKSSPVFLCTDGRVRGTVILTKPTTITDLK